MGFSTGDLASRKRSQFAIEHGLSSSFLENSDLMDLHGGSCCC